MVIQFHDFNLKQNDKLIVQKHRFFFKTAKSLHLWNFWNFFINSTQKLNYWYQNAGCYEWGLQVNMLGRVHETDAWTEHLVNSNIWLKGKTTESFVWNKLNFLIVSFSLILSASTRNINRILPERLLEETIHEKHLFLKIQ